MNPVPAFGAVAGVDEEVAADQLLWLGEGTGELEGDAQ